MAVAQKIDVSSSTIFRVVLILLLFWFLYVIRDILLMFFAAIVIAWAIDPIADRSQKAKIPRALTVIVLYIAGLALLSGVVSLIVPPLAKQITDLAHALPGVVGQLEGIVQLPAFNQDMVVGQAQDLLSRFGNNLANASLSIFQQTRGVLSNFLRVLFVFVITFYLVIENDPIEKLLKIVLPKEHVSYAQKLVVNMKRKVGRWVLAQLTLGIIVGTLVGFGLWLLGVPFALVLGIVAGVMEIIPVIGPVLAAIPGVIVAVTHGWVLGLATLGLYWIIQQLENHILVPNIMKKAVGLNPLVTLLAVLLGARLGGVAGVILAVPAATVISVFVSTLFDGDKELAG